jgi:hypothetical protein
VLARAGDAAAWDEIGGTEIGGLTGADAAVTGAAAAGFGGAVAFAAAGGGA